MLIYKFQSAQKVCHSHQGHNEQTWKESQRRKGKAYSVRRKLQLNNPTKRALIKQKKDQLTVDETLVFLLFPHVSNRGTTADPTCLSRLQQQQQSSFIYGITSLKMLFQ